MDFPRDNSILDKGNRREGGRGCILGTETTEPAAEVDVGDERERIIMGLTGKWVFNRNGEASGRSRHCVGGGDRQKVVFWSSYIHWNIKFESPLRSDSGVT